MTDRPRTEWTDEERAVERKALELLYGKSTIEERKQMQNDNYDNTNKGAIFANDNKTRDVQPDWSGPLNFEGTQLRLAGWIREDRNGRQFISLKVERLEQAKELTSPVRDRKQEDIPF